MRKLIAVSAMLLTAAGSAAAHEIHGPHTHPHGDWSGALVLLLAGGVTLTLFVLRGASPRRSKDDRHDPR